MHYIKVHFIHVLFYMCMCSLEVPISHLERSVPKQVLSCSFIQSCSSCSHVSRTCQIHSWHWRAPSVILQYIWCNATIKVQNIKSLGKKCSFRISHSSSILRCPVVKLNMLFTQRNVVSAASFIRAALPFQRDGEGNSLEGTGTVSMLRSCS